MKNVKQTWQMLRYNLKDLIGFELIFKVLSLLVFTPLFVNCFDLIMKVTGFKYITFENIGAFLTSPFTIILLLILLLLMMVYSMFDITTIIIILDCSYHKKKIKIVDAIRVSISKCKSMFNCKNIALAIMTLFIIPFLNLGIGSSFITTIKIPEYIYEYIVQNKIYFSILIIFILGLAIILLRWIYALHYYVLESGNFKEARKKSINLGKKNHIKDLIVLAIIQICSALVYYLFIGLGILIIIALNKVFSKILIVKSFLTAIIWLFIAISFIIFVVLSTPISYAGISSLYYIRKEKNNEKIDSLKIKASKDNKRINGILNKGFIAISVLSIIIGTIFSYGVYKGKYNLNVEYIRKIEVTAHRGASTERPENTMSAFIRAKELGADWIELDVQQIKDGSIIVMHDTNLKRTTGINKNTWEITWEELKDLDAGSFFDKKYKDVRVPLFEDVVKWAKENNIKLNVELKPTGKETNLEEEVINIIKEYDFQDYSVVTSGVYSALENVKKYDKDIKTIYVMSLAIGDITSLKAVDGFSIEASNITKKLVSKIHKSGRELYVWTVNTKDGIKEMIDYNLDNIITDDIVLTKDTIYESKTSDLMKEYIKFVTNTLK